MPSNCLSLESSFNPSLTHPSIHSFLTTHPSNNRLFVYQFHFSVLYLFCLIRLLQVLSAQTCQPLVKFQGHEAMVYSLAFNRSGSVLLSCSHDKSFMVNSHNGRFSFFFYKRFDWQLWQINFFLNRLGILKRVKHYWQKNPDIQMQ